LGSFAKGATSVGGPFSSRGADKEDVADRTNIPGVKTKESYLKYTPEDFQKKLEEFAF
jgi:hypothetical protein